MSHYFIDDKTLKNKNYYFEKVILSTTFKFESDNGVFSKKEIDFGSNLLVETFLKRYKNGSVLDMGCGYGFIGIVISRIASNRVDLVDINPRAIQLCQKNIQLNQVNANCWVSDGYENVNRRYDFIVTNPPIRIGKSNMYKILLDSRNNLNPKGELWIVIRKEQGAKSFIKDFANFFEINIAEKNKNFYILQAKPLDFAQ